MGALTTTSPTTGWRPDQWSSPATNIPALTMTVTQQDGTTIAYVFDTAESIEHEQEQVITMNPVQTGAAISDHAYIVPSRVTATLLMSDSVQSFTVGQFSTGPSRSVAAFQLLLATQATRTPVSIATRLKMYSNMMIESVRGQETSDTRYAGKFRVSFQQIITANVDLSTAQSASNPTTDSTRPQATADTPLGQTMTQNVPPWTGQQNNTANADPGLLTNVPSISGAGNWSSFPVNSGGF